MMHQKTISIALALAIGGMASLEASALPPVSSSYFSAPDEMTAPVPIQFDDRRGRRDERFERDGYDGGRRFERDGREGGRRFDGEGRRRRDNGAGAAIAAGVIGTIIAAGAADAAARSERCEARFRSYDPSSGTYIGPRGIRRRCPYL